MLVNQKKFANYLTEMQGLLLGHEFAFDHSLLAKVRETELVVPVIGAFSAGKSSLLNALIGSDILPVGIAPETELATELRYAAEPYLLAMKSDGSQERLAVEALNQVNRRSSEFSHLRLYLNSEALKLIEPLVLVDMPGFGSSLENHNKAISYYLPRAVHFIVLTSIEDGNITQSMLRKLDELKTYNTDFTFLLSKCNLRAPEQVEEVQAYVDDQLSGYFGPNHTAVAIRTRNGEELAKELKALQPEELFAKLFIDVLKDQNFDVQAQINLALTTLKKDKATSEKAARALEDAVAVLLEQRNAVEFDLKDRYSGKMLDRCLRGVDKALHGSLEELAALSKNPNNLSTTISDIIRSSLHETIKAELEHASDSLLQQIADKLAVTSHQMDALDISSNWSEDLTAKVKLSLTRATAMLNDWSTRLNEHADSEKDNGKVIYRSLSTILAVTTAVVNPLLELAIIFLPEILRMLNDGNQREQFKQKLTSEIFPGIKAELRGKLPALIDEQLNALLDKIRETFAVQINQQKHLIETFNQQNQLQEAQNSEKTAVLEQLANAVKSIANEHLYN